MGGFTLVEVMIAAAVLTVMSATTLVAFNTIHRNAVDDRDYANACAILHDAIERSLNIQWTIVASPPPILADTGGSETVFDLVSETDNPTATIQIFPCNTTTTTSYYTSDPSNPIVTGTLSRNVARVSGDPTDPKYGLLQVTMGITYTTTRGRTQRIEMHTMRAVDL